MTLRNDDLEPGLGDGERRALARVAAYLEQERPVPAPSFRGDLGRRLADQRPARGIVFKRRLAIAYAASGGFLLLIAAAGLVGIGPLTANDAADSLARLMEFV